jgi:HAD superfamily hydrolase (TIGR01509 family)
MTLSQIAARATALLLDFDGPICGVFAGYSAPRIAHELRSLLVHRGIRVPAKIDSPHALYVWAATRHINLAEWLDDELTRREVEAVLSAVPTPGALDLIGAAHAARLPVGIASNNASAAIRKYLDMHGVNGQISCVVGRPHAAPQLMKPHPAILNAAVSELGATGLTTLFVGDSASDMEAARRAGTQGVGYAKAPDRRSRLAKAGAVVVVDSMGDLADALKGAR